MKKFFKRKKKVLDAVQIEKLYTRFMFINMLITLACFGLAVEKPIIVIPLILVVSLAYVFKRPVLGKTGDFIAFLLLVGIFGFVYVISKGDTLFAAGSLLIGTYVLFFFRDIQYQKSAVSLLMILGLMLLSTSLLNRFEYILFFIPFVYISIRLLHYSLLRRQDKITSLRVIHQNKVDYSYRFKKWSSQLGIVVASLFVAIIIFVLIPRSHKWEFSTSGRLNIGKTGFDSKIASASVHSILSDPNVFFAVQTSNASDYFKGAIYDTFNGSEWLATLPKIRKINFSNSVEINERPPKYISEIYKFRNAPTKTIFYRGVPCNLKASGAYMSLHFDRAGNITGTRDFKRFSYLLEYSIERLPKKYDNEWIEKTFLQLPQKISTRTRELAEKITAGTNTAKLKAEKIEQYLKSTYPYTLNMSPGNNEVTDYFLFEAKRGYCIHFATAMTVMLRSLQVPARVIGGFRSGKYEKGHFIVSNEDAHAWVEVYEKDKGWSFFDPTPPQEDYLMGLSYWKRLYYKLYAFWTLDIVGFSYSQQRSVYAFIKQAFQWLQTQIWLILALIFMIYIYRFSRKVNKVSNKTKVKLNTKKSKSFTNDSFALANSFYKKMLGILSKISMYKFAEETPIEFGQRFHSSFPEAAGIIQEITDIFCEIQFGHREFTKDKQNQIEEYLKKLESFIEEKLNTVSES